MVFRVCVGLLHNRDDANDLTQDVFVRAFLSLSQFKGNAAFSTWLYRITVNAALNKTRKSFNRLVTEKLESFFPVSRTTVRIDSLFESDDPERILIRAEHKKWIQNAFDSLPENQRTAIVLSKFDDLPQAQIAAVMNISEGAVEALIQRAKNNQRIKLSAGPKRNKK